MLRPAQRFSLYIFLLVTSSFPVSPVVALAQEVPSSPAAGSLQTGAPPPASYPDSTSGLEHLAKDILKAQKENNGAVAAALLKSLILPSPRTWYEQAFGKSGASVGEYYERVSPSIAPQLAHIFLDAEAKDFTYVQVRRFGQSCDDNAGDDTYGVLFSRVQPIPCTRSAFSIRTNSFVFFRSPSLITPSVS